MEEQKEITSKGGTMRLGSYPCEIKAGTLAYNIYGHSPISERTGIAGNLIMLLSNSLNRLV
jgi:CTP synthase (UTP-ammonia lyase)